MRIPAGVHDGAILRLSGKGLPSPAPGGRPGDLHVVVRAARDPRFERYGADLIREETIAVPDAVLGTSLKVPTLDGRVTARVPAGVQPGAALRVQGKGLPRFRGEGRGDLFVRLRIRIPERLADEERELYERLRDLEGRQDG